MTTATRLAAYPASIGPAAARAGLCAAAAAVLLAFAAPAHASVRTHPVVRPAHPPSRPALVAHTGLATHRAPLRYHNRAGDRRAARLHAARQSEDGAHPAAKPAPRTPSKRPAPSKRAAPHASTKQVPQPRRGPRQRRLRPEEEADNDPPVWVRTRTAPRPPAADRRTPAARPFVHTVKSVSAGPIAAITPTSHASVSSQPLAAPPPATVSTTATKALTAADFDRAAAGADVSAVPTSLAAAIDAAAEPDAGAQHVATASQAATHPLTPSHPRRFVMPATEPAREAVVEEALDAPLPTLHANDGHVAVPPMRGTREILAHQNAMADSEGLKRIEDDADLNRMRAAHLLVALHGSAALEVNPELPENRRYARPWTARFVDDLARSYAARFHEPLRLNSAVRTVRYQLRLERVNGNAAGVQGDTASPHLTGQAIDFGKRGMSSAQIAWMRETLTPLMEMGKIDVEEEFQQACFHISVYRSYLASPMRRDKTNVAQNSVHRVPGPRDGRDDGGEAPR